MAFFVPFLVIMIAYAAVGIYPFGDRQIAIVDMYHQYIPLLSELQYKMQNGGNLFYSWNAAGGFNFLGSIAYYGSSPLNLILVLFPAKYLMEAVTLILMIKIGLAGLFMNLYLANTYSKGRNRESNNDAKGSMLTVAFGSMYALSSYVIGYYWCNMWIDVVALLPLCLLGLYRLINEDKPLLYCISLALALFSNYYIAYMLCVFIVVYLPVLWIRTSRNLSRNSFLKSLVKTAFYSVIGAGLSAIMIVPAYMALKKTYYTNSSIPGFWELKYEPMRLLTQLLPYAEVTHYNGAPNLYCGILAAVFLIIYFTLKTVRMREKIANAILLLFLFFSLLLNIPYFMWHGFHNPNCLPARFSFVVSFALVCISYETMMHIREIKINTVMAAIIATAAFCFLSFQITPEAAADGPAFVTAGTLFLAVYSGLIIAFKKRKLRINEFKNLFAVAICLEMLLTSSFSVEVVGNQDRTAYFDKTESVKEMLAAEEEGFWRTEAMNHLPQVDASALHHYKGITMFASTLNADHSEFMKRIGVASKPAGNRYDYVNANPLTNAMLGIRYLIDANADSETPYFTRRAGNDSMTLLENNYYLSVGYMLPYSVRGWSTEYENPFDSLNDYIRAATDGKVETLFEDAGDPSGFQSSITIENEGDGHFRTSGGEGTSGTAEIDYTLNADGQYYVCIDADQTANAKISIAGTEVRTIDRASGAAALVGYGRKGDQLKIRITYREDKSGPIYCKLARFNEEKWKEAYKLLSSEQMEVSDYGDTYIKGKIHAESDGVFLTSVLNEEGWKLYIDGKETEITPVGNFISAEFAAGEHDIELRYMSPGFIPGVILTIAAMIILGILCRYKGKIAGLVKIKKKEKMQAAGDEQKTGDEQNHEDEQNREAVNEREDVQESLDKQERENGQEQKNE